MCVNKLFEAASNIGYAVLIERIDDCIWFSDGEFISWNTDNNREDLFSEGGSTYSVQISDGTRKYDGYLILNGIDGSGYVKTMFFNTLNEVFE